MSRFREYDPLVQSYQHLPNLPRADEALLSLRKIASLVKPIMRNRGWKVGTLMEFYPQEHNLLGLNKDHGREICLRLRYARDQTQFLPLENVVDTMLHELSHNVIGPHNEHFHALWNDLRDEYERLLTKGYTGDGFLSEGRRLGGQHVPMHEMRRKARVQAEKRRSLQQDSGRKLGGRPIPRGADIREVIADAITRRATITRGCGSGSKEGDAAAEQAARNGFRTKAEEDDANEQAIAQALWELVQEDEARRAGLDVGEVRNSQIWSTDGLMWDPQNGLRSATPPPIQDHSKPLPPVPMPNSLSVPRSTTPPVTRKPISNVPPTRRAGSGNGAPPSRSTVVDLTQDDSVKSTTTKPQPKNRRQRSTTPTEWTCDVCTLVNGPEQLFCAACEVERPNMTGTKILEDDDVPRRLNSTPKTLGWNCKTCGTFMEHQWWTCSACGLMKASS